MSHTLNSHCAEEEAVLVCAVSRSEVVEVEDPNLEDSEVGTDTEVGNSDDGGQLWRWEKGGEAE